MYIRINVFTLCCTVLPSQNDSFFFSIWLPTCLQCSTYELPQPELFFYSLTRIISFRNPSTDPHHPNDIRVEYQIDSVAELDLYTQDILKNINMFLNDGFKMIIVHDTYYGTTTFKQYKKSSKVPKKNCFFTWTANPMASKIIMKFINSDNFLLRTTFFLKLQKLDFLMRKM